MSTDENNKKFKERNMFIPNLCDKGSCSSSEQPSKQLSKTTFNQSNDTENYLHLHSSVNHCVTKIKKQKIFCLECFKKKGRKKRLRFGSQFPCNYCKLMFCTSHRFMDIHNCTEVEKAKEFYRQELFRKNPGCIGNKIERI